MLFISDSTTVVVVVVVAAYDDFIMKLMQSILSLLLKIKICNSVFRDSECNIYYHVTNNLIFTFIKVNSILYKKL